MGWPAVCDYAILGHTLTFFETTIIVYDNTVVLHMIELYTCSSLSKLKSSDNQKKSLVFVGFIICYIVVLENVLGMSYSYFYIEHLSLHIVCCQNLHFTTNITWIKL